MVALLVFGREGGGVIYLHVGGWGFSQDWGELEMEAIVRREMIAYEMRYLGSINSYSQKAAYRYLRDVKDTLYCF